MKNTKNTEKDFDCVAMKRRAAQTIHQRLKDKTPEERLEYWQTRTEALRKRQRASSTHSSES